MDGLYRTTTRNSHGFKVFSSCAGSAGGFRFLVHDLRVWRRDDVDLRDQFGLREYNSYKTARFLITLLRDDRLVFAISPKSAWHFFDIGSRPDTCRELEGCKAKDSGWIW